MENKPKSLIKNSIFNILYKLLNVIFPLITSIYVSNIILSDGVGKVSFANNIVSYFSLIAVLGIVSYGPREIGKLGNDKEKISKLTSELFVINFMSTTICILAYLTLIFTIPKFSSNSILYIVSGIPLFLNYINVDWVYQGLEEYGYITIRSFIVKTLSFISLFIFVRCKEDYINYALISASSLALNYFFNIINLRKYIKFSLKELHIAKHLKPVFILLASSIAVELYTAVDVTMLGFMCTDNVVGYYNNASKIVKLVQSLITAICAVMLPRISYYFKNGEKENYYKLFNETLKTMLILAFPATIGLFIMSDNIILILYKEEFFLAINTLKILAITLPLLVINVHYGFQVLIASGNEKKYLITVFTGMIINLLLNPILILKYKNDGAAIATLISEVSVCISSIILSRKIINTKIDYKYIISIIISLIIMIISLLGIKIIFKSIITELIVGIACAIGVYFVCLLITKNDIMLKMKDKVLSKLA